MSADQPPPPKGPRPLQADTLEVSDGVSSTSSIITESFEKGSGSNFFLLDRQSWESAADQQFYQVTPFSIFSNSPLPVTTSAPPPNLPFETQNSLVPYNNSSYLQNAIGLQDALCAFQAAVHSQPHESSAKLKNLALLLDSYTVPSCQAFPYHYIAGQKNPQTFQIPPPPPPPPPPFLPPNSSQTPCATKQPESQRYFNHLQVTAQETSSHTSMTTMVKVSEIEEASDLFTIDSVGQTKTTQGHRHGDPFHPNLRLRYSWRKQPAARQGSDAIDVLSPPASRRNAARCNDSSGQKQPVACELLEDEDEEGLILDTTGQDYSSISGSGLETTSFNVNSSVDLSKSIKKRQAADQVEISHASLDSNKSSVEAKLFAAANLDLCGPNGNNTSSNQANDFSACSGNRYEILPPRLAKKPRTDRFQDTSSDSKAFAFEANSEDSGTSISPQLTLANVVNSEQKINVMQTCHMLTYPPKVAVSEESQRRANFMQSNCIPCGAEISKDCEPMMLLRQGKQSSISDSQPPVGTTNGFTIIESTDTEDGQEMPSGTAPLPARTTIAVNDTSEISKQKPCAPAVTIPFHLPLPLCTYAISCCCSDHQSEPGLAPSQVVPVSETHMANYHRAHMIVDSTGEGLKSEDVNCQSVSSDSSSLKSLKRDKSVEDEVVDIISLSDDNESFGSSLETAHRSDNVTDTTRRPARVIYAVQPSPDRSMEINSQMVNRSDQMHKNGQLSSEIVESRTKESTTTERQKRKAAALECDALRPRTQKFRSQHAVSDDNNNNGLIEENGIHMEVISTGSDLETVSDVEEGEESDSPALSTSSVFEEIRKFVKSVQLSPKEEIERETAWALWELQTALGDRYPTYLKQIAEPPLSTRPLKSLRYTGTTSEVSNEPRNLSSDFWSSKDSITDLDGTVLISSSKLHNFRLTLQSPALPLPATPSQSPDQSNASCSSGHNRIEFKPPTCRVCGSPDCPARTFRTICRKSRCGRCCLEGHGARRCRQYNPNLWNSRYLTFLDEAYKESLNKKSAAMAQCCLLCSTECSFPCCQFNPPEDIVGKSPQRFSLYSRDDILRIRSLEIKYWDTSVRWDVDVSVFQQDPALRTPRLRYSVEDDELHAKTTPWGGDQRQSDKELYSESRNNNTFRNIRTPDNSRSTSHRQITVIPPPPSSDRRWSTKPW